MTRLSEYRIMTAIRSGKFSYHKNISVKNESSVALRKIKRWECDGQSLHVLNIDGEVILIETNIPTHGYKSKNALTSWSTI